MATKTTKPASTAKARKTFSAAEKAAMTERAEELKRAGRKGAGGKEADEKDVLKKIAEMPQPDRGMAEKIHAIVAAAAPELSPKTWYGMPAYANKDGKVVCYFTSAAKFKERFATFGFNAAARLDDGNMWPSSFALLKITDAEEKKIAALVKKAAG